jgi:hypothetical protein
VSTTKSAQEVTNDSSVTLLDTAFRDEINKNARVAADMLKDDLSTENIFATITALAQKGWEHNDTLGGWPATEDDLAHPLRRLPDKLFGHMVGECLAGGLAILAGHKDVYLNVHSEADLSIGVECKIARQQRDSVYALNNLVGHQPLLFMGISRSIQSGSVDSVLFAPISKKKVDEMVSLSGRENGLLPNLRLRGHSASGAAGIAASCYTDDAEKVVDFLRTF